jgi:hypothetical protein
VFLEYNHNRRIANLLIHKLSNAKVITKTYTGGLMSKAQHKHDGLNGSSVANPKQTRIPTTIPTRMGAGYFTGFSAWVMVVILFFCIIIAPFDIKLFLAICAVLPLSICLYGFVRCGVFYTENEIIEKRYFQTTRIKVDDIAQVNLAYYAGYRYYETVITLQDKSAEIAKTERTERLADRSKIGIFDLLSYNNTPGEMQLKTVRKIFRKKVAHKFAHELLNIIRAKGNHTAKVVVQANLTGDRIFQTGYSIAENRFWQDFKE